MKKKFFMIFLTFLIISTILYGCTTDTDEVESEDLNIEDQREIKEKDIKIDKLENKIVELEDHIEGLEDDFKALESNSSGDVNVQELGVLARSIELVNLIGDKDMEGLQSYVHPTKGVRFTAYPYVDLDEDQVFQAIELLALLEKTEIYTWGSYDGTGDPIELSFSDYYDEFIYDVDFSNPELIGNNVIIGEGNTIDNVVEVYPNSQFIEFHFSGIDPQYEGIDWRSLKLVFEEEDGVWYLVGITHGQWTI